MKTALILCDAGPEVGGGHVVRSSALAQELCARGWSVTMALPEGMGRLFSFSLQDGSLQDGGACGQITPLQFYRQDGRIKFRGDVLPDKPSFVAVDGYRFSIDDEKALLERGALGLAFDDAPTRRHASRLLVDAVPPLEPGGYSMLTPSAAKILAGPKYACLRSAFPRQRPANVPERHAPERVMVSFGATDPSGVTPVALAALDEAGFRGRVEVVLGAASPSMERTRDMAAKISGFQVVLYEGLSADAMAELMKRCDFAIGAAGGSCWERCCMGLSGIVAPVAANQSRMASYLENEEAFVVTDPDKDAMVQAIRHLLGKDGTLKSLTRKAYSLCDGRGASRIADVVEKALSDG